MRPSWNRQLRRSKPKLWSASRVPKKNFSRPRIHTNKQLKRKIESIPSKLTCFNKTGNRQKISWLQRVKSSMIWTLSTLSSFKSLKNRLFSSPLCKQITRRLKPKYSSLTSNTAWKTKNLSSSTWMVRGFKSRLTRLKMPSKMWLAKRIIFSKKSLI